MNGPDPSFFTELEQHLDRAARRGARYGRLAYAPRPPAPVIAALLVAILLAAGALAIPRVGGEDAEVAAPTPSEVTPTPTPPADYGCDGPVHPETLAAYSVLRREPDTSRRFTPPDGITFLSEPVLARSAAGGRFWLIPAATPPDCAQPLICMATDIVSDVVQCGLVDRERSTGLLSRVAPAEDIPGRADLLVFAAAPDTLNGRELTLPTDVTDITADVQDNVVVGAARVPEEQARMTAESLMEKQVP